MTGVLTWGARLAAGWLASQMLASAADAAASSAEISKSAAKAAPWVALGVGAYLLWGARKNG